MRALTIRLMLVISLLCLLPVGLIGDAGAIPASQPCVFQTTTSSTGNGSTCSVGGFNIVVIQVGGTMTGAYLVPEGTIDGTNYNTLLCYDVPGLRYQTGLTQSILYYCSVKGIDRMRVRIITAGTNVTVYGTAMTGTLATSNF